MQYKLSLSCFFSFFILLVAACDQVKVRPKNDGQSQGTIQKPQPSHDTRYASDGPGGLFKAIKWYEYEMATHLIWPIYDVYAIQTPQQVYLVQIQAYYSGDVNTAGDYRLAFRSRNSPVSVLSFDAAACGNPFTNPDFEACQRDPERNVFTVVDFEQARSWKLTEAAMQTSPDWDMAFRGTEIRLNSGTSGPGHVRGALVKRFDFFLDTNSNPNPTALRSPSLQNQARLGFENEPFQESYVYVRPDGIDRVLHETYWYSEASPGGLRLGLPENRWILRSRDEKSFLEFRMRDLRDSWDGTHFKALLTFETKALDAAGSTNGIAQEKTILLSTERRLLSLCFDIDGESADNLREVPCGPNQWDLKLVAAHSLKNGVWTRDWRLFTGGGAYGPL